MSDPTVPPDAGAPAAGSPAAGTPAATTAVAAAPAVVVPEVTAVGARLRAGRDKLGLTVIQVAERLHLDPIVISSLESERYDLLGAPVYVRGHLRRYAEFVGEVPATLLDRYANLQASADSPDLRQAPRALPQADPRRYLWPAVIIAGLCVLAGILWWALNAKPAP
ncbi:MAG: helix-turn-helix domain-containing protein [Pseudomonadota bacterium]